MLELPRENPSSRLTWSSELGLLGNYADIIDRSLTDSVLHDFREAVRDIFSTELFRTIDRSTGKHLPKFFSDAEDAFEKGEPCKPIFYSARNSRITVCIPELERVIKHRTQGMEALPEERDRNLKEFISNRIEFCLHEYGHIASANRAIRCRPGAEDDLQIAKEGFERAIACFPEKNASLRRLSHVLSDLRAEVFRRDVITADETLRIKSSFAENGVNERVLPGGVLRSPMLNPSSIMRMAAWTPVVASHGPAELLPKMIGAIFDQCRRAEPGLTAFANLTVNFFRLYFDAHRFDIDALLRRIDKA